MADEVDLVDVCGPDCPVDHPRKSGHPVFCRCWPCFEWRTRVLARRDRKADARRAKRRVQRSGPEARARAAEAHQRWLINARKKLAAGLLPHGEATTYLAGCRCDPCIAAHAAKRGRTPKKPAPPDDPRHGTDAGYRTGCREDCCRAAHTIAVRAERAKRRTRPRVPLTADDPRHGSERGYKAGCRLECCKAAVAAAARERRAKREPLAADDPRHGTVTGYVDWGCREACCRAPATAARTANRRAA